MAIAIIATSFGYGLVLLVVILAGNRTITRIRRETGTLEATPGPTARQGAPGGRVVATNVRVEGAAARVASDLGAIQRHARTGRRSAVPAGGGMDRRRRQGVRILFAQGNLAVGTVAVGALSIGLVSVGGFAFGGLAVGGITLGSPRWADWPWAGWRSAAARPPGKRPWAGSVAAHRYAVGGSRVRGRGEHRGGPGGRRREALPSNWADPDVAVGADPHPSLPDDSDVHRECEGAAVGLNAGVLLCAICTN